MNNTNSSPPSRLAEQPLGHLDKKAIACIMAQSVVHVFESIEIHEQQSGNIWGTNKLPAFEFGFDRPAVGKTGERIIGGKARQLRRGLM
jgi:hypothetical protein